MGTGELTKTPSSICCVYTIEVSVIPGIKRFGAELEFSTLFNPKVLEETHIPLVHSGTPDTIYRRVAIMSKRWGGKC